MGLCRREVSLMNNPLFSTYNVPKPRTSFIIYTNDYLTTTQSNVTSEVESEAALIFNGFMLFDYSNQVNIPYEPIEGSSFSSDSVQDTPATIRIIGAYAPWHKSKIFNNNQLLDLQALCEAQLDTYLKNTTLLTIIKSRPLFKTYANYKLQSYEFTFNPDLMMFMPDCKFQEIRTNRGASAYSDNVNDVQNTANVDVGNVDSGDNVLEQFAQFFGVT
jgi:hypothetical protein